MISVSNDRGPQAVNETKQLVTVLVEGQLLGLPISKVHDVFALQNLTIVPRSPSAVAGLVNLRGRVVTMLSLRENTPANLDPRWAAVCAGIHKLPSGLIVEIDLNALLERPLSAAA